MRHMKYLNTVLIAAIVAILVSGLVVGIPTILSKTHTANASDLFEVNNIWVNDYKIGETPNMVVDREIKQDFFGIWTTDFERIEDSNAVFICGFSGRADYTTDAIYPDPLTLDWWIYEKNNSMAECVEQRHVVAGKYRICTTWRIFSHDIPEQLVRKCSNTFNVF